ncbi:MAG: SDR family oxidoreductase [Rhodospirillaceae bacterium]|jgi:NAD(P)-dependent dehydrogenase (short-subunit alcohol dehydrogenase family)|nr:SDR family oxidoreductase [Rhodospirillaceae bacterium]MBT4486270.1 SDR family oxidoreductase [Rhodospirillaceae bacterium]MBT5195809.1 SDR family oxidoreductase [Rhodospirillaceae bacterium]MBT5895603.1 SDR family oxidoreductase [Rhodospirillaceae bacterium]MBT6427648.1 SDR family oxidoreductase [Rhodospirillaceae bacterium]
MTKSGRLSGRTALITGATGGIGAATARLFAAEGAGVVICDLSVADCQDLADDIGGSVLAAAMNVTSEQDWEETFARAINLFGRIDVVMNCAGLFDGSTIEETTLETFDRLCDVNLKGVFLGCKFAIQHMKHRDAELAAASIINVSSTAGFVGTPRSGIYTMTKGGVRLFSKSVAIEVAELGYNIRCNSLHPGGTETGMFDETLRHRGITPEAFRDMAKTRNPLGRLAQPIEIAHGALFLASDESSFMTGSELALDGGYAAR